MALYAFTGYRLIPAFQQIFGSATTVRYNISSLKAVKEKIQTLVRTPAAEVQTKLPASEDIRPLQQEIALKDMVFQYPNATTPLINNLNLSIPE